MTIQLLKNLIKLDENYDLHITRLLILISTISERPYGQTIEGITKVVKLDFLLRYPTVLEKALIRMKKGITAVDVKKHERSSVESKMIRFKFGPWDHRYYAFLSILHSKGLIKIIEKNNLTIFTITKKGKEVAKTITEIKEFDDYVKRSKIIASNFGQLTGSTLMKKMYDLRPELYTMKFGEEIEA